MKTLRVVIIGAGIIGASIARVLSMYENFNVIVVEKEFDVGWGVSKANTGIIHPCHEEDPQVYPLRAKLCRKGNELWRTWVEELDIPAKWPGELMVFFDSQEEKNAKRYIELANLNRIPGVRIVYNDELFQLEPALNRNALGAVYAPTAGVISPFEAVIAVIENAVDNGVKLLTETRVKRVVIRNGRVFGVETDNGFVEADIVVNAAGLYGDEISHSASVEESFFIKPRKGEYLLFDETVKVKPQRVVHTTPTPITKGIYVVTTTHNTLLIGPTAEDLPYNAKEDVSTTEMGLDHLWKETSKLLADLPSRTKLIRTFAGLRPEPPDGNWLLKAYDNPWGFANAIGIRSPGLTAAPAIAYYILEQMIKTYDIQLRKKESWNPFRKNIIRLKERRLEEVDELIKKNPDYGEIICYCRMVSKAEILEAIERMKKIGVKTITLDGIKFRTLAMFGRCQGSFCRWRIALLISEYMKKPLHEVTVKKTRYGIGDIKTLLKLETKDQS
ncbi:MAG: NAD(P)/FAD-dependent oxidoreductase [Ignisphaera sp.]